MAVRIDHWRQDETPVTGRNSDTTCPWILVRPRARLGPETTTVQEGRGLTMEKRWPFSFELQAGDNGTDLTGTLAEIYACQ